MHSLPTMHQVMLDMLGMLVIAQVAVHLGLHQEEPDGGGGELDGPGYDPDDASDDEDAMPEPKQCKDLIEDNIIPTSGCSYHPPYH